MAVILFLSVSCVSIKGRLTQYSRDEYFSRAGDVTAHVGYIKWGAFMYQCVNLSEEKEYSTGLAFENALSKNLNSMGLRNYNYGSV